MNILRNMASIEGIAIYGIVVALSAVIAYGIRAKLNRKKTKKIPSDIQAKMQKQEQVRKSDKALWSSVRKLLLSKNRGKPVTPRSGMLLKILETPPEYINDNSSSIKQTSSVSTSVASSPKRPNLPPLPIGNKAIGDKKVGAGAMEISEIATTTSPIQTTKRNPSTLERIVVQMFEEYLGGISTFQHEVSQATTESEIIHKACRAFSKLTHQGRVVYLDYQNAQRAVMVIARSDGKVFAGTQPRMFLPLRADLATSRARIEDLRDCFKGLPQDRELQRLLQDACLLESPASGEVDQELLWSSRAPWLIFPMILRGVPQGFFAVQKHAVCDRKEFQDVMKIYLTTVGTTIENLRLHSRMGEINSQDNVTGLLTRKIFQERLQENFLIARRLKHPITLLRLDVQHMDAYTKRHGSHIRDAILRHVSRYMKRFFRQSDVLARFSNDGFAIIMPHTALIDAMKKSEELITALAESRLKIGSGEAEFEIRVDACAGLAEFPSHADGPSDLMRFATEAVYRGMNKDKAAVTMAKVPMGYVPPFNSRFIRSAPKNLQERGVGPVLDS